MTYVALQDEAPMKYLTRNLFSPVKSGSCVDWVNFVVTCVYMFVNLPKNENNVILTVIHVLSLSNNVINHMLSKTGSQRIGW